MRTLTIIRPDDWHVHLRDNDALNQTVPASARHFARVLVMPNLIPALTTLKQIEDYRQRIMSVVDKNSSFTPYMTLYLNDTVTAETLNNLLQNPYILGAKLYPANATTNSAEGVTSIKSLYPLFEVMQENNLVLQIHGEVTYGDIFDRERLFIQTELVHIIRNFPKLRIVLEHISTKAAVDFVNDAKHNLAATITPHHLLYNRNQLLVGGIKPHYYCLPILKHASSQSALQIAATSGNERFFAGTDSAPHPINMKESACGCAGVYSAPYALAFYTEIFDKLNKLDKLESFLSRFGALFYQLPIINEKIELINKPQVIPDKLPLANNIVVPLGYGSTLQWSVNESA